MCKVEFIIAEEASLRYTADNSCEFWITNYSSLSGCAHKSLTPRALSWAVAIQVLRTCGYLSHFGIHWFIIARGAITATSQGNALGKAEAEKSQPVRLLQFVIQNRCKLKEKGMRLKSILVVFAWVCFPFLAECKPPDITPAQTLQKVHEIMQSHATYKQLTPVLIKRIMLNYLEEIDPTKTYFIDSDIKQWTDPSDETINQVLAQFEKGDYLVFEQMQQVLSQAINRRKQPQLQVDMAHLPKHVKPEEFKDMKWVNTEKELLDRLARIKALQVEAAAKLTERNREKTFKRIAKKQALFEEEMQEKDPALRQRQMLTNVLKATASALDSHTAYFTPEEAAQFMINVQQRLFGIGAQLRDDVNGFTIVKIIEGGPAANSKELKVKDRIIAVNGEPVVGLDIADAVELIRGEENTPVMLTIVRETFTESGDRKEETLNVKIIRSEVVLKETRYESVLEPFGDGAIGYLRLFSFYQDPESSSATDLAKAIEKMKAESHLKGLILDLRYNSGGLLSQAVAVAGLFITKGVVVSIKDENGAIQHLRHLDEDVVWSGPLIVLINRASASASEIVAGTLQDYGRAIIVGDDHSYGKGSFQTFTLNTMTNGQTNPQGEYKVTRGRYYTVSGRTPQLTGVLSDIVAPGPLSEIEMGEKTSKYPLENDLIKDSFDDDLLDVPVNQRNNIRLLYKFNLQPKLQIYDPYLNTLKENSKIRIANNKPYQEFLKELKDKDSENMKDVEPPEDGLETAVGKGDLQLQEATNILKDLIYLKGMEKNLPPQTTPKISQTAPKT
ncbi:MAG: tail-specific protease Tsp [Parachlamydiaceae bacterium]